MSAYRSILAKRTADVKAADFDAVPWLDLAYLKKERKKRKPLKSSLVGFWNNTIPYTPTQIYDLFRDGHNDGILLSVKLNEIAQCRTELFPVSTGWGGYCDFVLADQKLVGENKIVVLPEHQGKGTGKAWLKNNVEFAGAMEFSNFPFVASLENGGYTWAKIGAHIDHSNNDPMVQTLRQVLQGRLGIVRPFLDTAECARLEELCEVKREDDLVTMTREFGHTMIPFIDDPDIGKVLTPFYKKNPLPAQDMKKWLVEEREGIQLAFNAAARQEMKTISLPRIMLNRTSWPAIVKFFNEPHMNYIGNNIGGWNTLVPA